MKITMIYELAHAAATDAGNAHMRKAGRKIWSRDDYNAMVAEFNRLWPSPTAERHPMPDMGDEA